MRLTHKQLPQHLQKQLARFYLVSGDEVLLVQEACALLRNAATKAGYDERIKYHIEPGFNWEKLLTHSQNFSLFSQQRLVEINIENPKLTDATVNVLQTLLTTEQADTVFLMVMPKLPANIQATKWYKAIEKHGVCVQVWPLNSSEFPQWLKQRMQAMGISISADALALMIANCEGNLLAAKQTIEKLHLSYGPRQLTDQEVTNILIDNSHYGLFDLIDAVLVGNSKQALKIFTSLRHEGAEPILVLWAISKELRQLYNLAFETTQGTTLASLFQKHYVREAQKPLLAKCLQRHNTQQLQSLLQHAARIDQQVKGICKGNVWDELLSLCLMLAQNSEQLRRISV